MDTRIPIKLATALLLNEGQISISDIEALPLVEDEQMAYDIARYLADRFDTYASQREISGAAGFSWEEVLVLRSPAALHRTGSDDEKAAAANPRHHEDFDRLVKGLARSYG